MTHTVTVIVLEEGVRRELEFTGIMTNGIEMNNETKTLTLWEERGKLLNTRWVVPFVSHYCVVDELEW
ncbi:hypothetical protein SEA_YABOI_263 [Streptomyces phage Yaboi]|jgi:hypothetical protein|uniref:Uncharacterized protein n=3 Tax=Streptomyces virus Yaboi TaxID=2846408 RepID=A0A411C4W5_9CAUD|nr:hypothetical protein HWB86_gp002 [Streptomyces phage Yaboi]YP_009841354.1 hypothetical protein HWB86_gp064 [Streptomyces phage Yaboi]QAY08664.1 hypothetical protein SEA_GENIE2_2 [Streptomyces phage Genie2]QAY12654.1 hypothetical protein SEA_BOOMERJR_2 [Streptomyces phage BoomerJR]UVD39850.1 hypothetical protein SEA_STANIMAL_2 [Streptomyces phage Stanimal]WNM73591.1 hypothetical protein SEA_SOLLERTIA_2 [Streptomyces phage Sollertia]AYB70841.1 hypothetical protein SEA_YABOI_2 [Streptomyces p